LVLFAALIGGFWAADHYFLHGRFTNPISDAVISGAQIPGRGGQAEWPLAVEPSQLSAPQLPITSARPKIRALSLRIRSSSIWQA
jgi:hypothetical protein